MNYFLENVNAETTRAFEFFCIFWVLNIKITKLYIMGRNPFVCKTCKLTFAHNTFFEEIEHNTLI